MKSIPESENALVIRTSFADEEKWHLVQKLITQPVGEFKANVDFIDEKDYEGLKIDKLFTVIGKDSAHEFIFLVDDLTLEHSDYPILCVDLFDKPGNYFRVIPSEMWSVENNLSMVNMEFEEFKNATDSENIFHGFPE